MPFEGALINFVFDTLKKHFAVEPASSPQPITTPLGKRPVYLLSNVSAVLLSVTLTETCELPFIEYETAVVLSRLFWKVVASTLTVVFVLVLNTRNPQAVAATPGALLLKSISDFSIEFVPEMSVAS